MPSISEGADLLIFVWLLFWAVRAGRSILRSERRSCNFIILTHFGLCGVPSLLNLVLGHPLYITFTNYQLVDEPDTCLLYAFYVCFCPVLWWYLGRYNCDTSLTMHSPESRTHRDAAYRFRFCFYMLALTPCFLVLGAPDRSAYVKYGAVIQATISDEATQYHGIVSASTILAVFAIAGILTGCRTLWLTILLWLPVLTAAFWLNGKRAIVLVASTLIILVFWDRRAITGWKLISVSCATLSCFAWFSYSYQTSVRDENVLSTLQQYEHLRVDYGREHGIKYALYCELHKEQRPILDYRAESLLFDLTMFIPRAVWADKPWPYAVYATAAGLGIEPEELGWGITSSWLEEAVANFGLFGILVGPLALALLCRVGDSSDSGLCRFLTMVLVCLLLAVQLTAFAPIAILWAVSALVARLRSQRSGEATHTRRDWEWLQGAGVRIQLS